MTGRFSLLRFISILTSFLLSICSIPADAQTPGLVGAYAFNESSGTTTADSSGTANTGILTNGAVFALGKNGNAVSLDGINDYVNLGANRSFLQNVSAATLSAWVKPIALGVNNEIIAISINGTTPTAMSRAALYFANGKLVAGGRSNDAEAAQLVTTVNTFTSNTWYHVAAVINYANDTITVYVNGAAQSTTGTPAFSGTTTSNTVSRSSAIGGEDDGSGNFFNGLIDDVRIYNRALSQSEIQADMNTPVGGAPLSDTVAPAVAITSHTNNQTVTTSPITVAGTASDSGRGNNGISSVTVNGAAASGGTATGAASANWSRSIALNPGANTITVVAKDASANQNSATVSITVNYNAGPPTGLVAAYSFEENGGTTAGDGSGNGHAATLFGGTTWVAGHSGSGLSFDGVNDFGTAPTVPYLPNWTISAWVRSPAAPSANLPSGPVHREANFQLNWDHSITSYRNSAMVNVAGAWHPASFGALAANTWYFLAATYNGDILNAYTNGVLVSSNSAPTGPAATDPNPLTFGKHAANPHFFRGTIDDVRVYNRALSLAEIQADMNTPAGGAAPPDTIPPSILMSAPANGSKLSGTSVTVSATASDNRGVAGVQFLLDGANLGAEDATSPYAITWNTTTATNGAHTLSGRARDSAGNLTTSSAISVIVDNQAPTGTVVINGGAVATNSTASTLTLSATDVHSTVTQMRFSNSGTSFSTAEPYATTKAWTLGAAQGTQTVYAQFMDAAGNWSASVTDTILLDTTAPTISAVASANISNSSATITWTTNEPATSQVEFGLTTSYGQTTVISATPVTSHSVLVSGLAPNTTYNYRARSKDAAGNERIGSNATFNTLAASDTTPPSTPAGLIATAILQTQINLSWAASTDNVGVTGYRVFRDSLQIATTSQTTYSNTGLSADTTYRYAVAAFDAAGNVSATSSPALVVTTASGPNTPAYPVKVSPNGRYLVDQNNVPFFMNGDSPHAMIGNISEADADLYFANRKALGFNTVSIYLLCASYSLCRSDAKTFDGIAPFTTFNDFSTPNETYFARADRILQLAAQYGFLVVLDPAETGSWLPVMQQNGVAKSRAFGQYVGQRYASFDNIIWMHGNDYGPPHYALDAANDALVTSIALGIKDFDNRHLHTVLFNTNANLPPVLSTDNPRWLPIIDLNAAYTYQATHDNVLDGYNYSPPMPVFMAETGYEFEGIAVFGTSPQDLRAQAYWTVLSGGIGQLFGSYYVWAFRSGWQSQLNTPGAIQTGYFAALFNPRRWYDLVPDQTHTVVTAGIGTFGMPDYVTAARTPDGKLVMAYIPTIRTITVDMSKISGPVTAQWYDPSNGTYIAIAGSPFANNGTRQFTPPGNTSDGFGDWTLVLETP